jgi:hypothetical protein
MDATKNVLNPVVDAKGTLDISAAVLAAGNVTAGTPLIDPMLNDPPAFDVVLYTFPLLSNQTPVAIFDVALESGPLGAPDGLETGFQAVVIDGVEVVPVPLHGRVTAAAAVEARKRQEDDQARAEAEARAEQAARDSAAAIEKDRTARAAEQERARQAATAAAAAADAAKLEAIKNEVMKDEAAATTTNSRDLLLAKARK